MSAELAATAKAATTNNNKRKKKHYKGAILSTHYPVPHPTPRQTREKKREVEYYFAGLTAIVPAPTTVRVGYDTGIIEY